MGLGISVSLFWGGFCCFWLQLTDISLLCFSLNHQEAETRFVPSVQDFDKKLAEADAYLQILIDQLKVGPTGATNADHRFINRFSHLCYNGNVPKNVASACAAECGRRRLYIVNHQSACVTWQTVVQSTAGKHRGWGIIGKAVTSVTAEEINGEPVRYSAPMSLDCADSDLLAVGWSGFKIKCDCAFSYLLQAGTLSHFTLSYTMCL